VVVDTIDGLNLGSRSSTKMPRAGCGDAGKTANNCGTNSFFDLDVKAESKRRHFFLYLAATAAMIALTFVMLFTSESYEFAKGFVAKDPRVLQVTGPQTSCRIDLLKGFRSTFGDRTGEA
jgi:hypothetical protein